MSSLQDALADVAGAETDTEKMERVRRLWDMVVGSVHLVDRGANKRPLLIKKRDADGPFGAELYDDDMSAIVFDDSVDVAKAVWTTAYINDLPDSAFLYIEPGGKKDEEGKTVPRSLRHFPVRDADGKLDLPHLRNAIARIPQAKIPGLSAADLRALQEKARRMLEEVRTRETTTKALLEVAERALTLVKEHSAGAAEDDDIAAEAEVLAGYLASATAKEDREVSIDTKKMAMEQAKSPQGCAYCDQPAGYGLVYNSGKEFIPVCGQHVMQGTNDLKGKGMEVEKKIELPQKSAGGQDSGGAAPEKGATAKAEIDPAKVASRIAKSVDDVAIELEKAGRRMSKARIAKFREALVKLLELAKELDPSEAQGILAGSIAKRMEMVEESAADADGASVSTQKSADGDATIQDGKADDQAGVTSVQKGADDDVVQWGVDLNDPSLHRSTVDKDVSFFG